MRVAVVRGAENINVTELGMYAQLKRYGHHVELICSDWTWVTESDAGMPERRLHPPSLAGRVSKTLAGGYLVGRVSPYRYVHQYLRGLHRAVSDFDVLSPVDLGHPTSYQAVQERRFGKKVLLYCAENVPYNWPHDRPMREHYDAVLDGADHFLALTEGAKRVLTAQGVKEERISRLNVGVDVEYWRPAEARPPRAPGPLRLLFVGRLHWQKGLQWVFEALELTRVPYELTVVGRGPDEARLRWLLEQRARRGNPTIRDRVRIISQRVSNDELRRLRQAADLQLVPSVPTSSWREQMNFAMLEGLSCGLPAIASDTGGIPEAVQDGTEGWLVVPDSPTELAAAIEGAAAAGSEQLGKMGLAARERIVRDFHLEKQGARLAEIVQSKISSQ